MSTTSLYPRRTPTIACSCGAMIPPRDVYDFYRLTPEYKKLRRTHGMGRRPSYTKQFMDEAEAAMASGETVLRFMAAARPGQGHFGRYVAILRKCHRIGYLEYVCPQCERPLDFQAKRRKKK